MDPLNPLGDAPGLDGPDYVTLLIEWTDEGEDATAVSSEPPRQTPSAGRTFAVALGAIGAIALTTWGLRRLRA
jgi:hypothetical protein